MSFGTSPIDAGTNPTLGVATDNVGGVLVQRIKLVDPNADQAGAYGIDSNPMRVRPRRLGTADYDSGSVAVASGAPGVVTAATVFLEGLILVNLSALVQIVNLTDTAGAEICKDFPLAPNQTFPVPVGRGMTMVGIKAGCGNPNVVKLRAWGTQ